MLKYDIIFEELQDRVNSGELSLEYAELVNNLAYNKYIVEDGHNKKLKARHVTKNKNIEKRFYDNMNYKHDFTGLTGTKYGTVTRDNGEEVKMRIPSKGHDAYYSTDNGITISRKLTRMKGSDLAGSHEYSHALDEGNLSNKVNDKINEQEQDKNSKLSKIEKLNISEDKKRDKRTKVRDKIEKDIMKNDKDEFDRSSKKIGRKFKIKNSHDRESDEMRADNYAIKTTNGENNSNRERKFLNEYARRQLQPTVDKYRNISNVAKKSLKSPNHNKVTKTFLKGAIKIMDSGDKDITNKYTTMHKTRQNVNDYIKKKHQEEKK